MEGSKFDHLRICGVGRFDALNPKPFLVKVICWGARLRHGAGYRGRKPTRGALYIYIYIYMIYDIYIYIYIDKRMNK